MHGVLGTRPSRHPSCATPHSVQVGTEPTRQQCQHAWCGEGARKVSHHTHDFKKSVWPLFISGVVPSSQRHGATLRVGCKSTKELPSLTSFSFTHSFNTSESLHFRPKPPRYKKASPPASQRSRASRIRLASKNFAPIFLLSKREGTTRGDCVRIM
jgi:hypothetical protein